MASKTKTTKKKKKKIKLWQGLLLAGVGGGVVYALWPKDAEGIFEKDEVIGETTTATKSTATKKKKPSAPSFDLDAFEDQAEDRLDDLRERFDELEVLIGEAHWSNNAEAFNEAYEGFETLEKNLAKLQRSYYDIPGGVGSMDEDLVDETTELKGFVTDWLNDASNNPLHKDFRAA